MSCFSRKLINLYFLICGLWIVSYNNDYLPLPPPPLMEPDTSGRALAFTFAAVSWNMRALFVHKNLGLDGLKELLKL